ncbi:MAG TPA: hypothetical protein VMW82_00765 [Candidatus Paceibacterota bacterium]|nr:hypothetical protein [Candidatus Paceibacterota bacterium]
MKNEVWHLIVLFFLMGLLLGVCVRQNNELGLMDPVLVMFISMIIIMSTGLILGAFPKLFHVQDDEQFWIGMSIFCFCVGTVPGLALTVKNTGVGVLMGMAIFMFFAGSLGLGLLLKKFMTAIISVFRFFSTAKGR